MIGNVASVRLSPPLPVRQADPAVVRNQPPERGWSPPSPFLIPSLFLAGLPILGIGLILRRCGVIPSAKLAEEAVVWLGGGWPKGCRNFEEIAQRLIRLSPAERRVALGEARWVRNADLRRTLSLALFDEGTWRPYVETLGRRGTYDSSLQTTLYPFLEAMPPELRSLLFKEVRRLYPLASKGPDGFLLMPPKRALDTFVRGTLRPDEIILRKMTEGKTAWEAYKHCFREWRAIFPPPYGAYTPDDVLAALGAMRGVLRRRGGSQPWSVVVVGSFPNGRALLDSSDIDVMISDPCIADHFPEINRAIAEALRPRHRNVGLYLKKVADHWSEAEMGEKNPVLFRVAGRSKTLVVYPPVRVSAADVALGNSKWPEPALFPI